MVKNKDNKKNSNNSSNSLVFGRWPQTKSVGFLVEWPMRLRDLRKNVPSNEFPGMEIKMILKGPQIFGQPGKII